MENSASGKIQREANSSIKNENIEIQEESRTSSGNENQNKQLVNDIETKLKMLEFIVPNECCIYKVPYHLRKRNEEAYTPHVISIGPYHHNKEKFRTTEKHKVIYFKHFMKRTERNLEDLVSTIRKMEDSIRCCYVETVQLKSDDFVEMIMFDAIFILELFLSWFLKTDKLDESNQENHDSTDPIKAEPWMLSVVTLDLVLLENQLPFFVIKDLYNNVFSTKPETPPLIQLIFEYFKDFNVQNMKPEGFNVEIKHFTDLLRTFYGCEMTITSSMYSGKLILKKTAQMREG